jgi:hypothetical protein
MALEVALTEWRRFAEALNREHEGDRVSLFAERRSGLHKPIARDVIFRSLAVDTEAGQRAVVVTVDANRERHLSHTISKPVSIAVDNGSVCVSSELGTAFTIEFASKEVNMSPLNDSLRDWGFDPAVFESRAKQSIENAKGDFSEITGVLRDALYRTKQTLLTVQKSGEPVAAELRMGFDRAWEEIEQAFARARRRVRESRDETAAREEGDNWLG